MKEDKRQECLRALTDGTVKLKAMTHLDPDSISDVAVEAMTHVVEHFIPRDGKPFSEDFCLIFFNAYMGLSKVTANEDVLASALYITGDDNRAAHALADIMRIDPLVCRLIFHAIQVYKHPKGPG